MVSELRLSKMDRDAFTSLLNAAAFVEDDYRPRIKYVVQRLEPRSPAFDIVRQVLERVEPHFDGLAAFNTAFAGPDATICAFYADNLGQIGTSHKWRIVKELVTGACPSPTLSDEERLGQMTRAKGETWLVFVDRYRATCLATAASRETQVKTLYRRLPANLRRLMLSLPSAATVADMSTVLRNASFWESSAASRTEADEDVVDVDMGMVQANVAATNGKVVGRDGAINFAAITNAGRVMVGAREICKTSRREALDMLRFLQRICNVGDGSAGRVKHVDGVANVIADLLSRSPWWRHTLERPTTTEAPALAATAHHNSWPVWYLQMEDYLKTGRCPDDASPQQRARLKHRATFFRLRHERLEYSADGLLWTPCCLDKQAIPQWLARAHEEGGHYGIQTTTRKLQEMIYFPDAPSHVDRWVRSCPQCQHFARHDPPVTQSFNTWQHMNQCVGLDVIGPMKPDGASKYIIAAVDLCTRFCLLSSSSQANATSIIKLLERWTALFGNPDCLQTDNDSAFVGNQVSNWMSARGIQRRTIPTYRPQCKGTVERLNQEVIRRLQRLQTQGKWASALPQIQAMLNAHPNSVTKLSAAQTAFGYQPRTHSLPAPPTSAATPCSDEPHPVRHRDLLATRWTAIDHQMQHQQQHQLSQSHRCSDLLVGSQVLLFDHRAKTHGNKLTPQWQGPYTVHAKFSPQLYRLVSSSSKKPFLAHRDHLRRFFRRSSTQGSDCHDDEAPKDDYLRTASSS